MSCGKENETQTQTNTVPTASAQDSASATPTTADPSAVKEVPVAKKVNHTVGKISYKTPTVDKKYLLGDFDYTTHPDFVKVAAKHTTKPDAYLRKETYEAFVRMYDAAKKDSITLTIISATRNFSQQKAIWEAKWVGKYANVEAGVKRAKAILQFSSMPSTSRHHWGTDIDLIELNNPYFEKGKGKKAYDWLMAHGHEYGFCNVYSAKGSDRPNGYEEEKWHWSYLPLSHGFLEQYKNTITLDDIPTFKGAETKTDLNVIEHYVGGINPACK